MKRITIIKSCVFFCFYLGEIVKNKNCDGRLEKWIPALTIGLFWKTFPWPLFPRKRKVANREYYKVPLMRCLSTKLCMMTTSGWKNFLKPGLAICPSNYFTACQKVISEELGKAFENITGTCIQHLKVFDPFMNWWQLFAIEVYVRVASQPKGGSRASLFDQRTPGSCLDHKTWDSQREYWESEEKLRQLAASAVQGDLFWLFECFPLTVMFFSFPESSLIHSRIHANGHSQSTQRHGRAEKY